LQLADIVAAKTLHGSRGKLASGISAELAGTQMEFSKQIVGDSTNVSPASKTFMVWRSPMLTSHFDRLALPPARSFYEREFGSALGRVRRGWSQTKCCFHDGKSKTSLSLNLQDGHFFCFSCGTKGGDVLAFVMARDKVAFKEAAQSLGAWREQVSSAEAHIMRSAQLERARLRDAEIAQSELDRQERVQSRHWLHAIEQLYSEATREHDWGLMSELLPRLRMAEENYWRASGLEVRHER
jgi:hypothetical protein